MQLVLSNNRVIAHGENFLSMGGVVINTETGKRYENATVAECNGCPSDIDQVGYEYHAGVFVPCAPYGKGEGKGYVMEVCPDCATPRNSGISMDVLRWTTLSEVVVSDEKPSNATVTKEHYTVAFPTTTFEGYADVRLVVKTLRGEAVEDTSTHTIKVEDINVIEIPKEGGTISLDNFVVRRELLESRTAGPSFKSVGVDVYNFSGMSFTLVLELQGRKE